VKFLSTRGGQSVGLEEALLRGIAADGGLYLPDELPAFHPGDFPPGGDIRDTARVLLAPFLASSSLAGELGAIVDETLHFPIPTVALDGDEDRTWLLELHHGPTAAFKDVGAGFLASCMSRLQSAEDDPLVVLVATSGDTGGAVAAAFDKRPGMRVAGSGGRLRRLPGTGQERFRRSGVVRAISLQLRKQHQHRPAVAAEHILCSREPRTFPADRPPTELHRAHGQSRQCAGLHHGAGHGPACRGHHSRRQCQSHHRRFPGR